MGRHVHHVDHVGATIILNGQQPLLETLARSVPPRHRHVASRPVKITQVMRRRVREAAALEALQQLHREGKYEEAEAGARALEEQARRLRRRSRGLVVGWYAKALATVAACVHGRGTQVLDELESLIAELRRMDGPERVLLLTVRSNRMLVLNDAGRHREAEAEGLDILRDVTRLKHLAPVWRLELCVLDNLVVALCGQGRYEEAEAIARGNLPRAEGGNSRCSAHRLGAQPERAEAVRRSAHRGTPAHPPLGSVPERRPGHSHGRRPARPGAPKRGGSDGP